MTVEKTVLTTPAFVGDGCRATVTEQVVIEVDVPGGKQTLNFPVIQLPHVAALVAELAGDADVADLIVAHTPEPEPPPVEPEPEDPPVEDPVP